MERIIFESLLIVFPFGQLIKFNIFNLFDVLVFLFSIISFLKYKKYPSWYKYFVYFILSLILGVLVNYQYFEIKGILYLIRLWSYSQIAVYIYNQKINQNDLINKLLLVSFFVAIFGFVQYLLFPNLTFLKYFNWDDHLLRMTGTFLDPAFFGLIISLATFLALSKNNFKLALFFAFTLMFTYSRASYLVLIFIYLVDYFKNKNIKRLMILSSVFLVLFLLPKNIGEGTNLQRTVSIENKLTNFDYSLKIISENPIFGVGFNNICKYRNEVLNEGVEESSHSCSGLDSSILFILATSGLIGLMLLINFIVNINGNYLLTTSFAIVLIHSTFTNSLFYPHIMYWLFVLVGIGSNLKKKN